MIVNLPDIFFHTAILLPDIAATSSERTSLDAAGGFSALSEHEGEPLWMTVGDTTGLSSIPVWIEGVHQETHFNDVQHTGRVNQQHSGHVVQFKLFTELKVKFLKMRCMKRESRAVSPCTHIQPLRAAQAVKPQQKTLHSAVVSFYKRKTSNSLKIFTALQLE